MDELRERVWCLEDTEVGSVKTEMCDFKKSDNRPAIIKTNEVMSINEPNYKAPEKCLATKELAGFIYNTVNM